MTPRALIRAGMALLLAAPLAFAQTTSVSGAGGTFVYPLASKWFHEYNVLNPKIQINYQAIGARAAASASSRWNGPWTSARPTAP